MSRKKGAMKCEICEINCVGETLERCCVCESLMCLDCESDAVIEYCKNCAGDEDD